MWDGDRLISTHVVEGLAADDWARVLRGCVGVVLEDGYVGRNRNTGLVLAWSRGRIEAIAELRCGAESWAALKPAVWRHLVGIPAGSNRKGAKQSARRMCRWLGTWPRPAADNSWDTTYVPLALGVSEDEAEAILLGLAYLSLSG